MSLGIQGILLAAGSASRFGSDKLAHRLDDGTPIVLASARHLREALPSSLAVVRSAQSPVAALLRDEGLRVVECPEAAEGMGSSLAAGVRASAGASGWVLVLGDMPFISPETIRRVAERLAGGETIVAPFFRGERGHPVGIGAEFRDQLQASRGDEGARALLREHAPRIARVEVDDPGVLRDIDTREDLVAGRTA